MNGLLRNRQLFFGGQIGGLLLSVFLCAASSANSASEFSFRTDILPTLTKAGCNAGACHGAATGQGGFRLSLLGYDPQEDHWNITREFGGRRLDTDVPQESLLLRKPTRQIEHEGGRRIKRDSESYRRLLDWVAQGAPYGSDTLKVTRIDVDPKERFFGGTNEEVQITVNALLSDGTRRNVTDLALYTSNDEGVAEVGQEGRVTTRGRGVTSVMVRFSGQVAAVRVAVPMQTGGAAGISLGTNNVIDGHIGAELARLHIPASPISDDSEFLRRVSLDLTGRLPSVQKTREVLRRNLGPSGRTALIEELLASNEFTEFWTLKFADLLLISGKRGSEDATVTYHQWLREQISENKPWDKIASALLTSSGDLNAVGPANFYTLASDPRDIAEYAGSIFLGTQIACARCHAHPTDRWTQDDYYDFAACFAGISREGNSVKAQSRGELKYPKSKQTVRARPLGAECAVTSNDPREDAAKAMIADPLFCKAMVNRVWKELMGRGLVEPVQDLRPTNPATHPALLEKLGEEFRTHQFDLRWLLREIASSQAYQLTSRSTGMNRNDDRFYSHALLKPLRAEVLVDAITQVTGVSERFEGAPEGSRAVQLVGSQTESYALDVLGRCKRERSCETSSGQGGGLAQALHLINGSTINSKLRPGILRNLSSKPASEIVEELYLRALARLPENEEREFWTATIDSGDDRTNKLEDFLWTLLNSREFAFNH